MNSIGSNCKELKKEYDDCFNVWFSDKFLKGHTDDSMCSTIFRVYQQCVKNAIAEQKIDMKEVERDVLGTQDEYKVPPPKNEKTS